MSGLRRPDRARRIALLGAAQIEGETENFLNRFGPEGFPLLHVPVKEGKYTGLLPYLFGQAQKNPVN